MPSTRTVRLTVSDHRSFQAEFPERFDWSLVINHREKEIGEMLASEVVIRRGAWLNEGKEGIDPLIPGLQEALRLLAAKAVWKVTQNLMADRSPEGSANDNQVRGSQRKSGDVSMQAKRTIPIRYDGRESQVPVARLAGTCPLGKAHGPRNVSYALGVEHRGA